MDILDVYIYGMLTAGILSLAWSFALDNNKPPTTREFALNVAWRALSF